MICRFLSVLLVLVVLLSAQAEAGWISGALLTNPATNAVVVDTGAVAGAIDFHAVLVFVWASVACDVIVQHVAADGTTVLQQQIVRINVTTAVHFSIPVMFGASQRVRVIMQAGVTGNVQGSIFYS